MTTFIELQDKVKKSLNNDFKQSKIEFLDLMSILYILGEAKDTTELLTLMEIYRQDYSTLDFLLLKELDLQNTDKEQDVQLLISSYLKENSKDAKELLNYIEKNKNYTIAELITKFPELKKYSDQ
jgi:hypothetical protein